MGFVKGMFAGVLGGIGIAGIVITVLVMNEVKEELKQNKEKEKKRTGMFRYNKVGSYS